MSRIGKHKKGKVRIGIYTDPYQKAVAVMLADLTEMTMTDIVWQGIETLAKAHGIITTDGKIAEKYKNQFEVAMETVKQSEVNG